MKTEVKEVSWEGFEAVLVQIRYTVFVDEQKVPEEEERDDWDAKSRHVLLTVDENPVGTGRLLPDGHIGRVAVLKNFRGLGLGKALMEKMIDLARENNFPKVELSAQIQAQPFYESLGFNASGKIYLEAGIEHIFMDMVLE